MTRDRTTGDPQAAESPGNSTNVSLSRFSQPEQSVSPKNAVPQHATET